MISDAQRDRINGHEVEMRHGRPHPRWQAAEHDDLVANRGTLLGAIILACGAGATIIALWRLGVWILKRLA